LLYFDKLSITKYYLDVKIYALQNKKGLLKTPVIMLFILLFPTIFNMALYKVIFATYYYNYDDINLIYIFL